MEINSNVPLRYGVLIHPSRSTMLNDEASYPYFTVSQGENKLVSLSKLNLDSIDHDENPCNDNDIESSMMCRVQKSNQMFVKEHNCTLPWMSNINLEVCQITEEINETDSVTIGDKAMYWEEKLLWNVKEDDCPEIPKCKRSIYKVDIKEGPKHEGSSHANVVIEFESPNVQNIVDTIAYDLQSLIGEVGGTLGLFLGLSTYSFVELIEYLMNKLFK